MSRATQETKVSTMQERGWVAIETRPQPPLGLHLSSGQLASRSLRPCSGGPRSDSHVGLQRWEGPTRPLEPVWSGPCLRTTAPRSMLRPTCTTRERPRGHPAVPGEGHPALPQPKRSDPAVPLPPESSPTSPTPEPKDLHLRAGRCPASFPEGLCHMKGWKGTHGGCPLAL